jgi:CRISPR-associated protein Csh1
MNTGYFALKLGTSVVEYQNTEDFMIREIIQFTSELNEDVFSMGLEPSEGLHIFVELKKDGSLGKLSHQFYTKKEGELTPDLERSIFYQTHSALVSMNKPVDSKKKIHSASPYVVSFKKQAFDEVKERLRPYLKTAAETQLDDIERKAQENTLSRFQDIIEEKVFPEMLQWQREVIEKDRKKKVGIFSEMKDGQYVNIYLHGLSDETYQNAHRLYLDKRLFNTDAYNEQIEDNIFGVGDFRNGFNSKKPFLVHNTSHFYKNIGQRITQTDALILYKFDRLLTRNKILPNPLPLFIEKKELNGEMIRIIDQSEEKRNFHSIIHDLYEHHKNDLGNYYLLYHRGGDIIDYDFVSQFDYEIRNEVIQDLLLPDRDGGTIIIENVFQIESVFLQPIFNNALIVKITGEGYYRKYFDDIDPKYIKNSTTHNLILKYRKGFYDYIYKSRKQAISPGIFYEICYAQVRADIKADREFNEAYNIRLKMNLWFSLNHLFDPDNNNFGGKSMPTEIPALSKRIDMVINDTGQKEHFISDREFAFGAGQLIYYLNSQSERAEKTHAALNPFLEKVRLEQFQKAIAQLVKRYTHLLRGHGRVERLIAQVQGYTDLKESLESLHPYLMAGYFADSRIYQKKEEGEK